MTSTICYDYINAFIKSNAPNTKLSCEKKPNSNVLYCYNNETNELCHYNILKSPETNLLWQKIKNNPVEFDLKVDIDPFQKERTIVIKTENP